ncbi:MAG: flagellar basal body P-ring formation protein FlgA [Planctomycetes bacterium]|nr:flagellar basal body P-ring formation protein FlgA [Planctomycetota bacterium]MBI3843038.1 flagellar basal body P-ring formation protein FlgA [Planctomycetota bacterium]
MTRRLPALALAVTLLGVASAAPAAPDGAAKTVKPCAVVLRASAESTGLSVRLGDVATIDGGDDARRNRLESLDVAATPGPGIPQSIALETVRASLRAAGFDAEATSLTGPFETRFETRARTYLPSDLAEATRTYVQRAVDAEPGVEVTIEPPDVAAPVVVPLGRESNEIVFDWLGPHRDRGTLPITVEFRVDGKRYSKLPLRVSARAFADAFVVKSRMRRGDAVGAASLERKRVEVTDLREPLVRNANELAILRVARDLEPGKPLVRSDFYLPPAVRKGETLRLVAHRGALTVSTLVQAQKDGVVGDVIPVVNVDSQRIVTAKVCGPGMIEADSSTQPQRPADAPPVEETNNHEPQR